MLESPGLFSDALGLAGEDNVAVDGLQQLLGQADSVPGQEELQAAPGSGERLLSKPLQMSHMHNISMYMYVHVHVQCSNHN